MTETGQVKSAAREKARARLLASLNPQQCWTFEHGGFFEVISNKGHVWRIATAGYVGNCRVTTRGGPRAFCAHLSYAIYDYPLEDHLLAQALLIRTDENAFRRIAH